MNPTPFELAQIAATLAKAPKHDFRALANDALRLYLNCELVLQEQARRAVSQKTAGRAAPKPARQGEMPNTPESPVPLGDFLRLKMPQKPVADRERLWRFFRRQQIRAERVFARARTQNLGATEENRLLACRT